MHDTKRMIITDESRNGFAAGAVAVIGSAFPVGWLFAASAARADEAVAMKMSILAWIGGSILMGFVVRFIFNIFWRPRLAYFSEVPISVTMYLAGTLVLSAASFYSGHSCHVYAKRKGELSQQRELIAVAHFEKLLDEEKIKTEQESLDKVMRMTFAEKKRQQAKVLPMSR